ncbi:hypothetical protein B0H19DRAFT_1366358 [Mycena capillaripes]|nr:hypothetical protein B0H19DRAFT_1366358 [Mycena capillaripes]
MAAEFATAAGAFNVASFVFGSGPDAYNRLNQILSTDDEYNEARKNGEFVLKTLEDWNAFLSETEISLLETTYIRHRLNLSDYQQLHLDKAQIKSWQIIDKLKKERKIRQAVAKLLAHSIGAKETAQSATEKARFKRVKSSDSSIVVPGSSGSSSSSGSSGSTTPSSTTYPPNPHSEPTLRMTNSMLSLLFQPPKAGDLNVHDRLAAHASKVGVVPPSAPDFAAGNGGAPLARCGTTDTAITAISEEAPAAKA